MSNPETGPHMGAYRNINNGTQRAVFLVTHTPEMIDAIGKVIFALGDGGDHPTCGPIIADDGDEAIILGMGEHRDGDASPDPEWRAPYEAARLTWYGRAKDGDYLGERVS